MTERIVKWRDDVTPISILYDDIYFSPENGLAESSAVFLEGINAPEVWQDRESFTICELGFGTGLNFFNCAHLWLKSTSEQQQMTYLATEKHFLDKEDIKRAIFYPELQELLAILLENYGIENFEFLNGRIRLKLLLGDSIDMLSNADFKADAWFLDGFAPSKNPDMWTEDVYHQMTRLSSPSARIATFTAAGHVRRGLEKHGFEMFKRKGFGHKREMLAGIKKHS